jgi:hypothetical protein
LEFSSGYLSMANLHHSKAFSNKKTRNQPVFLSETMREIDQDREIRKRRVTTGHAQRIAVPPAALKLDEGGLPHRLVAPKFQPPRRLHLPHFRWRVRIRGGGQSTTQHFQGRDTALRPVVRRCERCRASPHTSNDDFVPIQYWLAANKKGRRIRSAVEMA